MLSSTRKTQPTSSTTIYLLAPDVRNNQWKARGNNEVITIICNYDICLTEDIKSYLGYFSFTTGKNICHTLKSFSEIPIKNQWLINYFQFIKKKACNYFKICYNDNKDEVILPGTI